MDKFLVILKEDWNYLQLAIQQLEYSRTACEIYTPEDQFSDEALEKMEAFTARYARVLDIYTQKILKTIDILEGYGEGSLRDILSRCEKSNIIKDATEVLRWRILRNEIAHDYIPSEQRRIFFEVRHVSEDLLLSIKQTKDHLLKSSWID